MAAKLGWGIIGAGNIARTFTAGLAGSGTGRLVAVGTRNPDQPGFAADFPGARIHEGYASLLADPAVDIVYVATPHPLHAEWSIKAAQAGKHVLVEKPMALNAAEAEAMFAAARKAGTFMGEAYMYRFHPLTGRLAELIASGTIGEVRMIQSSFGLQMEEFRPAHRLYDKSMAGGGILDVGGYPVSMVRFLAGIAGGKPFLDPVAVKGAVAMGRDGVDEWAGLTLTFDNRIIAQISCAISVALDNTLRIHGATGWLEVHDFWSAGGGRNGAPGKIEIMREDMPGEIIVTEGPARLYAYEADAVVEAIKAGHHQFPAPGMSWADSIGNMHVLDKWRASVG